MTIPSDSHRPADIESSTDTRADGLHWSVALVEARARSRGESAEERLLAVFDVIHELFCRTDAEAREFAERLVAMTRVEVPAAEDMPLVLGFRRLSMTLATEAALSDPVEFLFSFSLLVKGAVLKAAEGDSLAALRGRAMASDLIVRFRQVRNDSAHCFSQSEVCDDSSDFDYDYAFNPEITPSPASAKSFGASATKIAMTPVATPGRRPTHHLTEQLYLESLEWSLS